MRCYACGEERPDTDIPCPICNSPKERHPVKEPTPDTEPDKWGVKEEGKK